MTVIHVLFCTQFVTGLAAMAAEQKERIKVCVLACTHCLSASVHELRAFYCKAARLQGHRLLFSFRAEATRSQALDLSKSQDYKVSCRLLICLRANLFKQF